MPDDGDCYGDNSGSLTVQIYRPDIAMQNLPEETDTSVPNEINPGAYLTLKAPAQRTTVPATLNWCQGALASGDKVALSIGSGSDKGKVWLDSGKSQLLLDSAHDRKTWTVGSDTIPNTVYVGPRNRFSVIAKMLQKRNQRVFSMVR
jgi:hypothetical protein